MKIQNYQPIKCNIISFQSKFRQNNFFGLKQLTKDIFQRTTQASKQAKEVSFEISEKEIKDIYDEALKFVLDNNPIMTELGIRKPKVCFTDLGTSDACYDFLSNTVNIGTKCQKEAYAYVEYDKKGELADIGITTKDKIDNEFSETKQKADKFQVFKLNPDEKKLYLKSIFVHELRHWVQEHILASVKGCDEHYNYRVGLVKELLDLYAQVVENTRNSGVSRDVVNKYKAQYKKALSDYNYILKLSPNRVLSEDYQMKVSFAPYETRSWSIKDHFLPASLRYKCSDNEEYVKNPVEIDAYNYQAEFLLEEKFANNFKNVRDDVFQAMYIPSSIRGGFRLDNIEMYGYPSLINAKN